MLARKLGFRSLIVVSLWVAACGSAPVNAGASPWQFAESVPVETALDDPAFPDAADVWLEMIGGAKTSIDIAQFYVAPGEGNRLRPVLDAIEAAAARGVAVRLVADAKFAQTYPKTLDALDALDGIEVRRYDMKPLTGGVLHAKYFIVDRTTAWIGSQNFDWRSLEHIQELGARFALPEVVEPLGRVFELDWGLAGGGVRPLTAPTPVPDTPAPIRFVASPQTLLPSGVPWDLPLLVRALDGAKTRIRVQLLSYALIGYDGQYWDELDRALRRAAARGVEVQMLLANWNQKTPKVEAIQSLAVMPNIDVRFVTIPPWSGGFVEFARVVHSKYLVVDEDWAWLGTSNWSRDYFHASRNVGVIFEGLEAARALHGYFERLWTSPYAAEVDPGRTYESPRIK